jgi:hypothetical protein
VAGRECAGTVRAGVQMFKSAAAGKKRKKNKRGACHRNNSQPQFGAAGIHAEQLRIILSVHQLYGEVIR